MATGAGGSVVPVKLVYADECFLRVYDGRIQFSDPRVSGSWQEAQLVTHINGHAAIFINEICAFFQVLTYVLPDLASRVILISKFSLTSPFSNAFFAYLFASRGEIL